MSETLAQDSIREQGYAPVPIDLSRDDLQEAIDRYTDFLTLPENYHDITRFYVTDRGDGDYGQFTRVAGNTGERGAVMDNKDIFHFGSLTRQYIEAELDGRIPREMKDFLDTAEEVFWAGQRSKRHALADFDDDGSFLVDTLQTKYHTLNDVLRLITYYENDDKLAKSHFDRGVCTLAIGESHEGLRLATGQNGLVLDANEQYLADLESRLTPVEHRSGEAKFFLGAGWNRLPQYIKHGHDDLELGWHDVVPSAKRVGERVMRWAVVMFINPYAEFQDYTVPTPAETRPYKQLGRLVV